MKITTDVVSDFDAIARSLRQAGSNNRLSAAERAVVAAIPREARRGLDVGCGDGSVTRAAAARGLQMTAIDLAPQMIALARERTSERTRIDFQVADLMTFECPVSFDVVFTINMVHHLPLAVVIPTLATLVAPGGRLIIQDVITREGLRYLPINVVAVLARWCRQLIRAKRHSRTTQVLYDQHGEGETYLHPNGIFEQLAPLLPGVRITRHLDWRYTAVWDRPAGV